MRFLACLVLLALQAACSPTLNWRELRPAGAGVAFMLPCKPTIQARKVQLGGTSPIMTLYACNAGEVTWALGAADVGDPTLVAAALADLRDAARSNLNAVSSSVQALQVPGATPNAGNVRLTLQGRLPDGTSVHGQVALFTKGTRVYQATTLGTPSPPSALATFFEGLKALE